ncbi:MAG: zinc ABC transporter substrate-binding protein [Phycisphaerae bacterium]|nr:zinc ABC transporter substrate-binding protein [Phycisphaerae bacterium]
MTRTVLVGIVLLTGCDRGEARRDSRPGVGVTTSYLECAVRDLAPDGFRIVRMLPPGGCPGHFDVTPKMVDNLRDSAVLLRFDFQVALDTKLDRLETEGLKIIPVPVSDGMSKPETYGAMVECVCRALSERWPERATGFASRLEAVRRRLAALEKACQEQVAGAGLKGKNVLCSKHQEAFCRWLGLSVAGTFPRGEEARISEYVESLAKGETGRVELVVGNLQEGTRVAQVLSARLGARMVVFSNFPSMAGNQMTFDDLFWSNVGALVGGAGSRPATTSSPTEVPKS